MPEAAKVSDETKKSLEDIKRQEQERKELDEISKKLSEHIPGVDWKSLSLAEAKKVKEKWDAEISKRKFASPRVSKEDQSQYNGANLKIAKFTTEFNKDQMSLNHYIQSLGESHSMDVSPAVFENCLIPASILGKLNKNEDLDPYEQLLLEEKHPLEDHERKNLERITYTIQKTQNRLVEAGLELQKLLQDLIDKYSYDGLLPIEIDEDGHFKHSTPEQQTARGGGR